MAATYLPYEPDQMLLLPEAIQDCLPEGHLEHFISDTVDTLDLNAFHARYDKDGPRNQPFHPAMMVKVLVHGYASGGSRKIARKLHGTWPSGCWRRGNFPAHRTVGDFRAIHLQELSELFVQVVRLVKLGTIAVDGTKVKANATRHKAMSYGHMVKAEAEAEAELKAQMTAMGSECPDVRLCEPRRRPRRTLTGSELSTLRVIPAHHKSAALDSPCPSLLTASTCLR